ncbi:MAG: ATP-binding protein [Bacteroidales bacterium]|jgi:PAS domain S-box-containing protein|nr:ATP-binding protein [Bacteroidales bacterium]
MFGILYRSVLTITLCFLLSGAPCLHASDPPASASALEVNTDQSTNNENTNVYTHWFVIIILILFLLTVVLAWSKLISQRKANKILAHQRNILKQTVLEQRLSEDKYRALFSQANDAIFLMDHETFVDCNDKTLEMFECKREEIIGHPPYDFSPKKQPDGKRSKEKSLHFINLCHDGKPQRFYWQHTKKDGSVFDAEVSLNNLTMDGKAYIQAIVRNISERVRAEREMVLARDKAEKATESKTFFLAKMSHEIRTMLGGITNSAQMLRNTEVNDKQSELLDIINTSANNLLSIVNEILDFSKIEAGKIDIEDKPFNLKKTLEGIVSANLPSAKNKGITLFLSIHNKMPDYVSGDELRLRQIITNLITNAIKFTEEGSVQLEVSIHKENKTEWELLFNVLDTGIGIPENRIKDMFAQYSQSDVSISRRYGGTGLGLNIVYNLVNIMNGKIDVSSEVGKGTSFMVNLSFGKTDFTETNSEVRQVTKVSSDKVFKVLLAEDNVINQKITMINLQQLGHGIDLAVNGIEAWEMYLKKDYDVILMDIQMPEMDGIEVTHMIRKYEADHPEKKRTRIVALTANILGQDAEYCLSEGMDAYIPKPFSIEDILEKLEEKEG